MGAVRSATAALGGGALGVRLVPFKTRTIDCTHLVTVGGIRRASGVRVAGGVAEGDER